MSDIQRIVDVAISEAQSQDVELVFWNGRLTYFTGNTDGGNGIVRVCELPQNIAPDTAYARCLVALAGHGIKLDR